MESKELSAAMETGGDEIHPEAKGNGNLKRKHGADASSDDENDFLGFDLGECGADFRCVSGLINKCGRNSFDSGTK